MNSPDRNFAEIISLFGLTIHTAQSIELVLINYLMYKKYLKDELIIKTRYDEIFSDLTKMTFGQLKRELLTIPNIDEQEINYFHKTRDNLVHHYFWNKSVEMANPNLNYKVLDELYDIMNKFNVIEEKYYQENRKYLEEKGVNLDEVKNKLLSLPSTPAQKLLRKLNKDETLIDVYGYKLNENEAYIPIFVLEDETIWTVYENGLSLFENEINPDHKTKLDQLKNLFPIQQFNPKPKIKSNWNYDLDLKKKGLIIRIMANNSVDGVSFRWAITKK